MLFKNKFKLKTGIISLIFIFCLTFLSNPALAASEPWKSPPVPNGWTYVEGAWNNGYVIKDSHGNEFVWVPVGAVNNVGGVATLKEYDWGQGITAPSQVTYETIPSQITNAIATTGGFYIARYEASYNSGKAQSKKNVDPWHSIDWYSSKSKAESMASDYGWTGLYSHLLYDKEWDLAVKWLENSGVNVTNSTAYGNYSGSSSYYTGSSETYKKNNIYDLAGNLWEWTMDAYSSDRLVRGGSWGSSGSYYPVSFRTNIPPTNSYYGLGFRPAFVVLNSVPSVVLTGGLKTTYSEVNEHNMIIIRGTATDADNDNVTVHIQVKKSGTIIGSDNQVLQQCQSGKEFSFELTVDNEIAEGKYNIEICADDGK